MILDLFFFNSYEFAISNLNKVRIIGSSFQCSQPQNHNEQCYDS